MIARRQIKSVVELLLLLLVFQMWQPIACGEILRFPLSFSVESGTYGNYLAAPFNLGTSFSHVESLQLELLMPMGFSGSASATSNSSRFREFVASLHASDSEPKTDRSNGGPGEEFRSTALLSIPQADSYPLGFSPTSYSWVDGEIVPHDSWPVFVLHGQGRLALIDQVQVVHQPLGGSPASYYTSTSWVPPEGIVGATLIVSGITAPEPSTILIAISTLLCATCRTPRNREGRRALFP